MHSVSKGAVGAGRRTGVCCLREAYPPGVAPERLLGPSLDCLAVPASRCGYDAEVSL